MPPTEADGAFQARTLLLRIHKCCSVSFSYLILYFHIMALFKHELYYCVHISAVLKFGFSYLILYFHIMALFKVLVVTEYQ